MGMNFGHVDPACGCASGPSTYSCGGCTGIPATLHATYVNTGTAQNFTYQFNFLDNATPASPSWISYPTGTGGFQYVFVLGCGTSTFGITKYILKDGTPYPTTSEQLNACIANGTASAAIVWPAAVPSSCSPFRVVLSSSANEQMTVTP